MNTFETPPTPVMTEPSHQRNPEPEFDPIPTFDQPGRFITLEGIEGCGKSTQSTMLAEYLGQRGLRVTRTKEPGGTRIGAEIRKVLLNADHVEMTATCEALLYLADRAQHHGELIAPALAGGVWVVCDRYHDSTLAYQGAARALDPDDLNRVFHMATGSLQPHLTLLLDLDVRTGLTRAKSRNEEVGASLSEGRLEAEDILFHQSVRDSFLQFARMQPERFVVIDAEGSPQEVFRRIRETVDRHFGL